MYSLYLIRLVCIQFCPIYSFGLFYLFPSPTDKYSILWVGLCVFFIVIYCHFIVILFFRSVMVIITGCPVCSCPVSSCNATTCRNLGGCYFIMPGCIEICVYFWLTLFFVYILGSVFFTYSTCVGNVCTANARAWPTILLLLFLMLAFCVLVVVYKRRVNA